MSRAGVLAAQFLQRRSPIQAWRVRRGANGRMNWDEASTGLDEQD